MEAFRIKIAGVVIDVQPLFQSTREYCKAYLTEEAPEFFLEVTPQDLVFQQALLEQEAVEEGLKIRKFQEPFLERATIQRKAAQCLYSKNILMLHGSTVAVDGKAYLFTAPCKTGKSTHTRLWREVFGARAVMVNDDMPLLKITEEGVFAYGSPWTGKHGLGSNICARLQGICFLRRGKENEIRPLEAGKELLYHQAYGENTRALVDILAEKVPLWEMACNMDLSAARIAYEAMSGNRGT